MTLEELKVLISAEVAPLQKGIKKATSSLNGFQKQVQKMNSRWNSVFNQMGRTVLKFLSVASLIKWGKDALRVASDLEEWQNVVNVAFGKATDDINAWATTLANKFGLVELQAKKMSSTFMAMGNAEGVATDKGIIMAKNLTQLSGDMASFFNVEAEEVATALESVYTGTTLALRKYGIVLTEANLNQFAMEKNLGKTVQQMNQAEKATLRYNYVMEKMAMAQGDFSRTSVSWANQVRMLKQNWIELLSIMGNGLSAVLAPLLALLNNLAVAAIRVAQAIAAIFGKKITQNVGGLSSGFEDVGSSIDDATGSAKKFKAQLASFDELDILKEDEDSGSGLGAFGGGGWDVGDLYDVEEAPVIDGIKLLNEKLEEWNQKLKENYDKMVQMASEWGKQFSDAFLRIRWDLIGEVLANGLDIITGSMNAFIDALDLDAFGRKFSEMFNHFFQELNWVELGKSWGNKLYILAEVLYGFFDNLDWVRIANSIETAFQSMFDRIPWEKLGLTFAKGLNGITTIILEWSKNFPIRDFINNVWLAIKTALENVDWKALGQALSKLINQAIDAINDIDFSKITQKIAEFIEGLDIVGLFVKYQAAKISIFFESLAGLLSTPSGWAVVTAALGASLAKAIGGIFKSGVVKTALGVAAAGLIKNMWKALSAEIIIRPDKTFGQSLMKVLGEAFSGVGAKLKAFGTVIIGPIKKALEGLIGFFKTTFGGIALIIGGAITAISNFVSQWQNGFDIVKAILTALGIAITAVGAIILGAPAAIAGVIAAVVAVVAEGIILVKDHWEEIKAWFAEKWELFKTDFWAFLTSIATELKEWLTPLSLWTSDTTQGLIDKLEEIWASFRDWLAETWEAIKTKVQEIWNAIKEWFINLITDLKNKGVDAFNLLKEGIGSALDGIKGAFSAAWSFIVGDTVDKFSTLVSKVGDAVAKIGSAVSSMLSTIANGISSAWSSISSFVSNAIAKLASVVIPHFANGGVLDRPTVGLMGEYAGARTNPEIVTPESKMREVFAEGNQETNQLLDRMMGILVDIYEKDNSITIGDDVISASAARGNLAYKKRTGRSQFAV